MAKAYRERPSQLLQMDWDGYEWLEYSFDRAVMLYGQYVDNELERRDEEGKPVRTLKEILDAGPIQKYQPKVSAEDLIAAFGNLVAIKP